MGVLAPGQLPPVHSSQGPLALQRFYCSIYCFRCTLSAMAAAVSEGHLSYWAANHYISPGSHLMRVVSADTGTMRHVNSWTIQIWAQ